MDDGRLDNAGERWQLTFVRRLPHVREKVWRALTQPEHLAAWFPTTVDGERRVGAPLRFTFAQDEAPAFNGEMLIYDPPSLMEFNWGEDKLRFELRDDGDGCVLILHHIFDEKGRAARDAAGWHVCLDTLALHLNGAQPSWTGPERWKPLNRTYQQRFGPDASTVGIPESLTDYQ